MGAMRVKVPLEELIPLARKSRAPDAQFKKTKAERLERGAAAKAAPVAHAQTLVDVRGQRVDDAIRQLEEALDKHIRDGVEALQMLPRPRLGGAEGRHPRAPRALSPLT